MKVLFVFSGNFSKTTADRGLGMVLMKEVDKSMISQSSCGPHEMRLAQRFMPMTPNKINTPPQGLGPAQLR